MNNNVNILSFKKNDYHYSVFSFKVYVIFGFVDIEPGKIWPWYMCTVCRPICIIFNWTSLIHSKAHKKKRIFKIRQQIYSIQSTNNSLKCCLSAPGDLATLWAMNGKRSAFAETDSRGWLPFHRASVQPNAEILDAVLLGEWRIQ